MKTHSIWLLVCLMLLSVQPGWTHGDEGGGVPQATLKKLFPAADSFVTRPLNLKPEQRKRIETRLAEKLEDHDLKASAYVASSKGRSIGVAWSTDAHLKQGVVDVIVGLDLQGKVVGVALAHSPVPALGQSSYLNQYKQLTARSEFREGKDLKSLPGQPGSAVVAKAAKKAAVVIDENFLGGKK